MKFYQIFMLIFSILHQVEKLNCQAPIAGYGCDPQRVVLMFPHSNKSKFLYCNNAGRYMIGQCRSSSGDDMLMFDFRKQACIRKQLQGPAKYQQLSTVLPISSTVASMLKSKQYFYIYSPTISPSTLTSNFADNVAENNLESHVDDLEPPFAEIESVESINENAPKQLQLKTDGLMKLINSKVIDPISDRNKLSPDIQGNKKHSSKKPENEQDEQLNDGDYYQELDQAEYKEPTPPVLLSTGKVWSLHRVRESTTMFPYTRYTNYRTSAVNTPNLVLYKKPTFDKTNKQIYQENSRWNSMHGPDIFEKMPALEILPKIRAKKLEQIESYNLSSPYNISQKIEVQNDPNWPTNKTRNKIYQQLRITGKEKIISDTVHDRKLFGKLKSETTKGYVNSLRIRMPRNRNHVSNRTNLGIGRVTPIHSHVSSGKERESYSAENHMLQKSTTPNYLLPGEMIMGKNHQGDGRSVQQKSYWSGSELCPENEQPFRIGHIDTTKNDEPLSCNASKLITDCPLGFYCHVSTTMVLSIEYDFHNAIGTCCGQTNHCGNKNSGALTSPEIREPVECSEKSGCPEAFFCRLASKICCSVDPMAGFCNHGAGFTNENGEAIQCAASKFNEQKNCPSGFECISRFNSTLCCPTKDNVCSQPVHVGKSCFGSPPEVAYYFDTTLGICRTFNYSGCSGNDNRFQSEAECQELCRDSHFGLGFRHRLYAIPTSLDGLIDVGKGDLELSGCSSATSDELNEHMTQ